MPVGIGLGSWVHQRTCCSRAQGPIRQKCLVRCQRQQILVCTNSQCRKKGGAVTLKMFQRMSPPDQVKIVEQNCLDECPMGPNCGIEDDVVRVFNGIKTEDDVAKVLRSLGVEPIESPVET